MTIQSSPFYTNWHPLKIKNILSLIQKWKVKKRQVPKKTWTLCCDTHVRRWRYFHENSYGFKNKSPAITVPICVAMHVGNWVMLMETELPLTHCFMRLNLFPFASCLREKKTKLAKQLNGLFFNLLCLVSYSLLSLLVPLIGYSKCTTGS